MNNIVIKPPALSVGKCCRVCKQFKIRKGVCKKHSCCTFLYLVCDDFEMKSNYERYLDRINGNH